MTIYVVAGVPGAGKSTLTRLVSEKSGKKIQVVNFGDEMKRLAVKRGLVKNKEELRKLPPEVQEEIQRSIAEEIAGRGYRIDTIVETDCSIKTPNGYLPGFPIWVLEKLNPAMIIILEAEPDEILVRRALHPDQYELEYVAAIDEHQRMNRVLALTYAIISGATVKIIQNRDNMLDRAIGELEEALS
jgi:adenylate kinase